MVENAPRLPMMIGTYLEVEACLGAALVGLLQSVSWSLAEFRHNKIVQSPHENYFNICRQHK